MGKTPVVHLLTWRRFLAALAALALLAVTGCGSDSSGETSTATPAAIPTVTSPLGTTTAPTATAPAGNGKAKPQTTSTTAAGCTVPDAYQDFKYTGIDCTSAVAVAQAWDQNGKDCNTVDNPNVPEGYHRTCSVEGFSCTAKRDVHSDGRFVTCTQGGQSIRFTWLPA
jgi:hypothetical protein